MRQEDKMMSLADILLQIKYQNIESVLASQRLEGLEPDPRTLEDLKSEARGEMTMDQVRSRVFERIRKGEI